MNHGTSLWFPQTPDDRDNAAAAGYRRRCVGDPADHVTPSNTHNVTVCPVQADDGRAGHGTTGNGRLWVCLTGPTLGKVGEDQTAASLMICLR